MRFNEFKILTEAVNPQYYAIGDSHAVAVGSYGGNNWKDLAVNGASAGGSSYLTVRMLQKIKNIEPNGVVLVSLGANDAASGRDPSAIANDVKAVVDKVKEKNPSKIVFLLFPKGPGRTSKDKSGKGMEYQEKVRSAIESSLDIPIIDLDGKPLKSDGVHAQDSVYLQVANDVLATYKPGTDTASEKSVTTREKTVTGSFKIPESPTGENYSKKSGGVSPELMDIQKALVAMDYSVGPMGADGRFGKFTKGAIKKFQAKTPGLVVDGDAGPLTVRALNAAIAKNPEKFKTLVNSKRVDIKSSAITGSKEEEAPEPDVKAITKGKIGALLNLISSPESGGNYDSVYPGKRRPQILDMTLTELMKDMGQRLRQNGVSTASGRYQFTRKTLKDVIKGMGIDPDKIKFTPETQDKLIIYRLRSKRKLDAWLDDKLDGGDREFMELLAQEFAGFPAPSRGGKSYYGKDGYNKALLTLNQVADALQDIKEQ